MNKKGWLRIVEAFFALLLIAGALLAGGGGILKEDISSKVYSAELSVLREIEFDNALRQDIMDVSDTLIPIEDDNPEFPVSVKNRVNERIPDYLTCKSKICNLDSICAIEYLDRDIYAQPVAITATRTDYKPRQLKLFCWAD